MAIRYSSVDLGGADLFGICLSGTVSRTDKQNLLALADRCLARGKLHLILDMTALTALGGGGARVLADFQLSLTSRGGEAVFVGAGKTVRRFLLQKFDDLPLRYFPSVTVAQERFTDPGYHWDPDAEELAAHLVDAGRRAAEDDRGADADAACGAVAGGDDDDLLDEAEAVPGRGREADTAPEDGAEPFVSMEPDDAAAEARDAVQDVLDEFNGREEARPVATGGRRKDHHYTSLAEAAAELGRWKPGQDDGEFAIALRNLLFSHGLAEDSVLLTRHEDLLREPTQQWELPAEGPLAGQLLEASGPLTMLDLLDGELLPAETELLEHLTPDLLLPIRVGDALVAVLLLMRGEGDREYSVAEHFALELLMRLLADALAGPTAGTTPAGAAAAVGAADTAPPLAPGASEFSATGSPWTPVGADPDALAEALMQLALKLPEARDVAAFWRLFGRQVWPVLPLRCLGFVAPGLSRPQVIAGNGAVWDGLELGDDKLRHFLRAMELPVRAANLPNFFRPTREALLAAGVDWIVGLNWQDEYLGTALLGLESAYTSPDAPALLTEVFAEAARLLHRLDAAPPATDIDLEILRVLVEQNEKRCQGGFALTGAMLGHLRRLSRAMGFTAEQERDLLQGCLLRDLGLVGREDALMGPRPAMDPTQWPRFRQHPTEGASLLRGLQAPQTVIDVVVAHHERFNGKGFPLGLKGRQIPLAARVVKVVENWVSLVTGDASRPPLAVDAALEAMLADAGERFDPDVVAVFVRSLQPDRASARAELAPGS
jgi:anti-anti-sigma regulatory factor